MLPLVLHPPSLPTAQFGQPRFNSGPERLSLNRPWSAHARGRSPRATFTRQSMSGSPPAEEPSVTSAESKAPRYPSASSPPSTAEEAPVASNPASNPPNLSHRPSIGTDSLPTSIPSLPLAPPVSIPSVPLIPPRYGDPGPLYTDAPRTHPGLPQYPIAAFDQSISAAGTRALAQKSTRRTKAHVASACVNCKKKHLGCDPARPCRRCVLAGKASSCVDVTHKKRGRPPLKAEDSSLRSYTTHPEHATVPVEPAAGPSQRASFHRQSSSRELRPMTDLQGIGEPGPPQPPPPPMRGPRGQPHRWSASVFPLTRPMETSPGMLNPANLRPFSSSGPASYAQPPHPAAPPPAFAPATSGFNPAIKTPSVHQGLDMRFQQYPGPALPLPTSPPQPSPAQGGPYMPYAESPSSAHHQLSEPRLPSGPVEPNLQHPVRLPPIHQATASPGPPVPSMPPGPPGQSYHAHRLSDPYPTTWASAGPEESPRDPRAPVQLQRPVSSVFTHPSHHQRSSSSTTGPLNPVPRHLGPIELPTPLTLGQSSPSGSHTTQPGTEAESEPRPIKRRKMALDDMVNG